MLPTLEALAPLFALVAALALISLSLTAISTPSTGAPEIGTLVSLIALSATAFFIELQPIGLLLLLAALGCFVAYFRYRSRLYLPVIGFVLQLIGSILLTTDPVSILPSAILLNIISLVYFLLVIRLGLKIQSMPTAVGADTLIGAHAVVIRTIDPLGSIKLDGEIWQARSDRTIPSGSWVRIISREGLELLVTPTDPPY